MRNTPRHGETSTRSAGRWTTSSPTAPPPVSPSWEAATTRRTGSRISCRRCGKEQNTTTGCSATIMTTKPLMKSTSCCGSRSCGSSEAGQSREKHGDTAVLFSALSVDQAHRAGKEKAHEHSQAHRLHHPVHRAGRRCCGAAPADGAVLRDWPGGRQQSGERRGCRGIGISASGLSRNRGLFSPQSAPYAGVFRGLRSNP